MHIFHKWETVKRSNKYRYQECRKCGKRRVFEAFEGGYQPVDSAWIEEGNKRKGLTPGDKVNHGQKPTPRTLRPPRPPSQSFDQLRKAEAITQAAKAVYDELSKVFDEDTAKELLIASMPAICADVTKHVYIPSLTLGGMSDKPEVWGNTEPETIVPLENLTRTEPGWIDRLTRELEKAMKSRPTI